MRKLQFTHVAGIPMPKSLLLKSVIGILFFTGIISLSSVNDINSPPNYEMINGPGTPAGLPWTCDPDLGTIMKPGIMAVSCGTILELDPADRFSFGMFDISNVMFANNRPVATTTDYHHPSWHVDSIGNVFGLAIDNDRNIYATASTHYGAGFFDNGSFNPGVDAEAVIQFGIIGGGADDLGAAGTIYKIDGITGQASVFAQLPQQAFNFTHEDCESSDIKNRITGPALGNIEFDKSHQQFFVTNFEDGKIYRLDINGAILSSFDPFLPDNGAAGIAPDILPYGVAVNPQGTKLFFGTNEFALTAGLYSIDLDASGEFSGVEVFHRTLTGDDVVGVFTTDPWISVSDIEYRPDGNLMVGIRTGCNFNFATSHNHGGTYYVLGDNDNNGLFDNFIESDFKIHYPNDPNGPDDGYGGIGILDNGDGTYTYALSSADIKDEPGPHGVIVFPDTYQTDGTGTDYPLYPSAAIPYFSATTSTSGDFKGVGGDVLGVGVPFSSIGNYVWYDVNKNGLQEPGEPPIEGLPVYLLDKDMNRILEIDGITPVSDTTDENGIYLIDFITITGLTDTFFLEFDFNDLPGTYPTLVQDSVVNVGGAIDSQLDSDLSLVPFGDGFKSDTIILGINEFIGSVDAGIIGNNTLGDVVFEDVNGNCIQDGMDQPIENVKVYLKFNGTVVDSTLTNAMGIYSFSGLLADPLNSYSIQLDLPAGYKVVTPNKGGDPNTDSDIDPVTLESPPLIYSGPDQVVDSIDALIFLPVSIGDTAWVDVNGNGLQDLQEPGLEGVTVMLQDASGNMVTIDADGNSISGMTTTDMDGYYEFTNLIPGTYKVKFDVNFTNVDGDYILTQVNVGTDPGTDSDADPAMTGMTTTTTLFSGQVVDSLDAGYFIPVSIGDTIYVDNNGNGLQDGGEPGLNNVSVKLFKLVNGTGILQTTDYLGNDISNTTSDNTGYYKFETLLPGQYYVEFDVSTAVNGADYHLTYDNINGGNLDSADSDPGDNFLSDTTAFLTSNQMDCTLDAGYFLPVSIGDTAWIDVNLDGIQDLGEPGLGGIIVTLYYFDPTSGGYILVTQDLDGDPIIPQITDPIGYYLFENLPPGLYYVNFNSGGIPPTDQDVNNNMNDDEDSDIDLMGNSDTLLVTSGMDDLSFDAGYEGLDYGDLPDNYVTTDGMNLGTAPKHVMRDGKFLGLLIDQDSDGQPSADGAGDDALGSPYILPAGATGDDEDGIEFLSPLLPGNKAYIKVTYSSPVDAYLRGWIDYDGDATAMDASDEVMVSAIDGSPIIMTSDVLLPAAPGGNMVVLEVMVPETAVFNNGNAYARFRFSCSPGLGPDGLALDGEIEDYVVPLGKLGNIVWQDENYDGLQDINDAEPGIEDVNVVLRYTYDDGSTNFEIVDTVKTDVNGTFYFCGLIESTVGKYEIIVVTPDGLIATKDDEGMDDTLDSDGDMFFDLGKDSVRIDPFMIMDFATDFPTGENGYNDMTDGVGSFPDDRVDQSYDFGFVSIDFGDLPDMDFGDLPASYNEDENGMNNPPSHIVTENKRLGSCVDSEPMEQPDDMGMGDDGNMGDNMQFEFGDCSDPDGDEDGVEFLTPMIPGDTAYVKLTYTLPVAVGSDTSGYVNGWIDFDGDGTFNAGDEVVAFSVNGTDLPDDTDNIALGAGTDSMVVIGILVPETSTYNTGMAFTRWRLSCEGGLNATGVLPNGLPPEGEVEEYVIPLAKVGNVVWLDQNYNGIQDVADEEGIEDVEVQLTYTTSIVIGMTTIDLTIMDTTYTDDNGEYYFCGLIGNNTGEYKLTVISPNDLTPTFANEPGVSDSLDSDNAINMGDTIVMTDPFMIPDPFRMPEGENGLGDDPNIVNNFPDTLVNQTYDFGFVPLDYGDHDSTYVTVKPDGGPVHVVSEIKYLGAGSDAEIEADADEDAGAIDGGDDGTVSDYIAPEGVLLRDDEDGITFLTPLIPGYKAVIRVNYTLDGEDGFLNGWIDWNGNGMFDHPIEALEFYVGAGVPATDYPLPQGVGQTIDICFDVPVDAMFNEGNAHARFRLSCDGGLLPTGGFPMLPGAPQGEVEDYFLPLAKIGNLAWYDNNLDGDQDSTDTTPQELGIEAVRIYLKYAGFGDNTFEDGNELVYEIETLADGTYNFCGLISGSYLLLPSKYADGAMNPADTIPMRYILTIADNTDQGFMNDLDSDFTPGKMITIPDLLFTDLVNATDMNNQNENGYLDNPGTINGFPDTQDDLTCDLGYIPEPNIEAILNIPGVQPPASNICGHFNVILDVCLKNTGYVDDNGVLIGAPLEGPNVNFDFMDQLGAAFVDVVSVEVLTALEYEDHPDPVTSILPTPNAGFDGKNDISVLSGDGLLLPDEEICVRIIVEIAPDNLDMMEALALDFSAIGIGNAVNYQGQPIPDFFNGGVQYVAMDSSDMDFEFVGGYDDPDVPEPLGDCWKTTRELVELAQVNLSVDENCELMIDATSVLVNHMEECDKGEYPLGGFYAISIQDHHQQGYVKDINGDDIHLVPMASIDGHPWIGEQWKISVHPVSQHCNSVWGYGKVEDKLPPTIICEDVTISCVQADDYNTPPLVEDNCWADIEKVNEVRQLLDCDPDFIGKITRTWIATDLYGNESAPCIQTIWLERTDLSMIMWPENKIQMMGNALECGSGYAKDANGHPDPSVTGVPKLKDVDLYPFDANIVCNGFVDYQDKIIQETECFTRIERKWTVGEWWCSMVNDQVWVQMIEVEDTRPPQIISCPSDITVSTESRSCTATVLLPPIEYVDACGSSVTVNIIAEQGSLNNSNGGLLDLDAGLHTVAYVVQDHCGNSSSCEIDVLVVDENAPVIICEQDLAVSLGGSGVAKLRAIDLDNGSFDECTKLTYEARRMDDICNISGTDWAEEIKFCCEDAGQIVMVSLRVTDESGNSNVCMVEVSVQDKLPPQIVCLDDLEITCNDTYVTDNLSATFGLPEIVGDNCPSNNTIRETDTRVINQCGIGSIHRHFEIIDINGALIQECDQWITITGDTDSDTFVIDWPEDLTDNNLCSGNDLHPDNLPPGFGWPVVPDDFCTLIGMDFSDEFYDNTTDDEACFKIIRTWKVIDWCNRDVDPHSNVIPKWEWEQIIKIGNTVGPTITGDCTDKVFENLDSDCGDVMVSLSMSATDDCTPPEDLLIRYEIDEDSDGDIDYASNGATVEQSFKLGAHSIRWEVEDKCGNITNCEYTFVTRNIKSPTPFCIDGISIDLIAMDTNNDMVADTAMAMLRPEMVDAKSEHPCGYDVQLSFSSDVTDTLLILGCGDVGNKVVELWVTDTNGNQSYCSTNIWVTANGAEGFCGNAMVRVAGQINTSNDEVIESVAVELMGSELPLDMTDGAGRYAFEDMITGGSYEVIPEKNDDPMNGVSTLDIVHIQRHVLGITEITDPYLLIAADINGSGSVTASDIIELRKLILGHYEGFPNNSSWRFIDSEYEFIDPLNPWDEEAPESYLIEELVQNMDIDFIGLKVGDISGDAAANARQRTIAGRSSEAISFTAVDRYVTDGEEVTVEFEMDKAALNGYQMELHTEGLSIAEIAGKEMGLTDAHVYLDEQVVRMSINDLHELADSKIRFTLKLTAAEEGYLSEMIFLTNERFTSEAYVSETMQVYDLGIDWILEEGNPFAIEQNQPNPWLDHTSIGFIIPKDGEVTIMIRDIAGKLLMTNIEYFKAGKNRVSIRNNEILSSGVLIYEVIYGGNKLHKRMIKVK